MDVYDIGNNLFHLLIFIVFATFIIKIISNFNEYKLRKNREFYNIEYHSDKSIEKHGK